MTFKHEYVIAADHPDKDYAHKGKADQCEYEIGKHIARVFGWERVENYPPTFLGNMGQQEDEWMKLEIQVFPNSKYLEFKKQFVDALPDYDVVSRTKLINAIAELESFGKPAGPKKEQL
jgi:hypothetical protein